MAFSRTGDTITQTGVDTELAEFYQSAEDTSRNRFVMQTLTKMRLAATNIDVQGEWTLNAYLSELLMHFSPGGDLAIRVRNNAILRLDSRFTFNGVELQDNRVALTMNINQVTFTGCIVVDSGGRIEQYGPLDFRANDSTTNGALMIFQDGATHFVREGSIRCIGGTGNNKQIRYNNGSNIDAKGLENAGVNFTFGKVNYINAERLFINRIAGFGVVFSGQHTQDEILVLRGFKFSGVDVTTRKNTATNHTRHIDPENAIDDFVIERGNNAGDSQTDFTSTVKFNATDTSNNAIAGARAVILDNPTTAGTIFTGWTTGEATEYDANTAQNQTFENDETHLVIRSVNTSAGFFHRGKDGSADLFDFRARSFLHLDQNGTIDLSAPGEKSLATTLIENVGVTETDEVVVEAYTIGNTPRNFYDYDRLDRTVDILSDRNITIDLATETIDYGDMNVVISGTPTPSTRPVVYNDDNTQATLYVGDTGVFTGNIVTTGSLELQEGATVDGTTRSSRGTTVKITGFPDGREGAVVAWPQANGIDNAANSNTHAAVLNNQAELLLDNDTEYFIRVECLGYRREVYTLDTTTQGSLEVSLDEYGYSVDGVFNAILPATLTADEQTIADIIYVSPQTINSVVTLTLPTDYTTDTERWNDSTKTYTLLAKDFVPIAYAIKQGLLQEACLERPHTINLNESELVIESQNDTLIFEQNAANTDGVEFNFAGFTVRKIGDNNASNEFINRERGSIRVRSQAPSASLPALNTIQTTLADITDNREANLHSDLDDYTNKDDWKGSGGTGGSGGASASDIVTAIRNDNIAKGLVEDDGTGADRFSAKALEQAPTGAGGAAGLTTEQSTKLDSIETSVVTNRADLEKFDQDEFNARMDGTTEAIQDKYKATATGGAAGLTTEQEGKLDDLKTGQTEIKNGQLN